MAAREEILAALRRNASPGAPSPVLDGVGASFPDLAARFAEGVAAVGGGAGPRPRPGRRRRRARGRSPFTGRRSGSCRWCRASARSTLDAAAVKDPHDLEGLDLAVLPGALAVAENGAIWIEGASLPHHALVVVPEHLAVVVEARAIVPDLHAAYARLDLAGRPRWGLFLAGPSKTADIEQALVIGAHGARSLTVLLVG